MARIRRNAAACGCPGQEGPDAAERSFRKNFLYDPTQPAQRSMDRRPILNILQRLVYIRDDFFRMVNTY